VRRRTLVRRLCETAEPLVLVVAPAGWGKSTTLMQWSQTDARPSTWLQLHAMCDDPVVFITYLAAALLRVTPLEPAVLEALDVPEPPFSEHVLPRLSAAVSAGPPFLLLLDDGQAMTERRCWDIVAAMLDDLPPGAQVAVAARHDPPLPLARLHAAGALAEVRSTELAFTRSEAKQLLRACDRAVDTSTLDDLMTATEGWPAGFYLTCLAGSERSASAWPKPGDGGRRHLAAYLASEVFDTLPSDVQEFLLHTCILDTLDTEVCQVVSGRADAYEVLHRLATDNLFVLAVGEHNDCYRHHHLFSEYLRAELTQRDPAAAPRLHRLAAECYAVRGELDAEVHHRLAAGDIGQAAHTVAAAWPRLWTAGQRETVRRWLGWFTDRQILEHVPLTLTAGWVYSALDDVALGQRWGQAACSIRTDDRPSPDGAASLRASQALLRATLAPDGVTRMREDAELAAHLESRPGTSWYADAMEALGTACWLTGATARAVRPLQIAAREGNAFNPSAELAALGVISLVHADLGDWGEAKQCADQAVGRLAELGYGTSRRSLPLVLADARVRGHAGHCDPQALTERIEQLLTHMVPHPWMTVLAATLLGEICVAGGDPDRGARWCARAGGIARLS